MTLANSVRIGICARLIPHLGAVTISRLRFDHVDSVVSGMIEDELASKTIHNAVMLLRSMLAGRRGPSVFRRGLAFADPTLGVKLPPLESRQIVPPTLERVWAPIYAYGGVGYPIIRLGAFCGMRRSEALGLRFPAIRWFDREIRIQHAISKQRCQDDFHKWEWYLGPPKSRKSLRGISATESVMRLLAGLKVGNADSAFVLPGDCHGFIDPDRMARRRHTFGISVGHSSIHVTFDTRGRLFSGRGKETSGRHEKSMKTVRRKSEANVGNASAVDSETRQKPEVSN